VHVYVGPRIEVGSSWKDSRRFPSSSDFVFAFRLSKLTFKRRDFIDEFHGTALTSETDIHVEDAGQKLSKNVISEQALDDNEDQSSSMALYLAETYTKGAAL
jgi:hypothetical protein